MYVAHQLILINKVDLSSLPEYTLAVCHLQGTMLKLLVLGFLGLQASAMELTTANFAGEVLSSGKNAFVKFQAPW